MRPSSLKPPVLLCLSLILPGATAAELAPSATRITVQGKPRIYRCYGQVRDVELYAPVGPALEALGIQIRAAGADVEVRSSRNGDTTVRWPVVGPEAFDRIYRIDRMEEGAKADPTRPPSGSDPVPPVNPVKELRREPIVLRVADELYLPVRAAAALAGHAAAWDDATRTLHLVPTIHRVEVTEGEGGLRLQIDATGPIRATSLFLTRPLRTVVDLSPAVLGLPDEMPAATGAVKTIRAGQFTPTTARVVLEAPTRITISGLPAVPAREIAAALVLQGDHRPTTNDQRVASTKRQTVRGRRQAAANRRRQYLASRGGSLQRRARLADAVLPEGPATLAGKVICVDAGHGGHDPGAHGINGLLEKDACLDMARELARALRESGAEVLMTRDDDVYVSLDQRIEFANTQGCDLFISIHCNSTPRRNSASGTQTYYCTPQSVELAEAIHSRLQPYVAGPDGGVRRAGFKMIRLTTMPSVLLEVAYINHEGDAAKLAEPDFRRGVGDAVRDGIVLYFGE